MKQSEHLETGEETAPEKKQEMPDTAAGRRAPHGGDVYGRDILYDFSTSLNPLGMPKSVKEALAHDIESWSRYPDPYCRILTEKLSAYTGIEAGRIVCGNGAADLIWRITAAFKLRRAVICAPTFSEYAKALAAAGSEIIEYRLTEENGFSLDAGILELLDETVQMLVLCSPNNPTGRVLDAELLERICGTCRERKIIFLCDESFLDFVRDGEKRSALRFIKSGANEEAAECFPNDTLIVLKAFTKIYAMAGLRLGYALFGSRRYAERVRDTGQFWSVSSPAQTAGIAALSEKEYLFKTADVVEAERKYLCGELKRLGIQTYPSDANFILLRSARPLDRLLLREKILIRCCENYSGLDGSYFRIAVRTHEENTALIDAVSRAAEEM